MNYCPASFWLSQYVITPFLDTPASYAVNNISGLWFQPTPLKNDGVFSYEIPNFLWKNNPNVPNHQPGSE